MTPIDGDFTEPHPDDADDLAWWVLYRGFVFSDDPREDLAEAADVLERRLLLYGDVVAGDQAGRAAWSLVRASRSWGFRNFTGT